jgi:predicted DNA-binding protein (UPF0251 family)
MSIVYTYEIVAVDEAARVMEVVYTAEGHPTQHVGARLPYEGESLEAVIGMYAPVAFWEEQKKEVVIPSVGLTGSIDPEEMKKASEAALKEDAERMAMWRQVNDEKKIAAALVKFGVLESDPTTIEVSQL